MRLPLRTLCKTLAPRAPELISEGAWSRVGCLARDLPPLFGWTLFECRLLGNAGRVDVLLCISRRDGDDEALRTLLASGLEPELLSPALPFLAAWQDPQSVMSEEVPHVWLEYDLPGSDATDGPRAPFVQYCVDRRYGLPGPPSPLAPGKLRALAEHGLSLLLAGEAPEPTHLDMLQQCAERLPQGARILHLGVMPARGTKDIRVQAAVPADTTAAWLDAIDWPGSRAALAKALALTGSAFHRLSVQIDVGDTVRPLLGIEFPLTTRPDEDVRWKQFMDALVEAGACDPAKARASLDWIGEEVVDAPEAGWPVRIERRLDVKLVLAEGRELEAKGYLACHARYCLL